MGFLDRLRSLSAPVKMDGFGVPEPARKFEVTVDPVMLYGPGVVPATYIAPVPRVSRRSAMQVPAVKRARDLIPGTLGQLPVEMFGLDNRPEISELLAQPEPDIARSVTMTLTYEDMFFEGRAWWYVLEFDAFGVYPTKVRRLDSRSVTVTPDLKVHVANAAAQGCAEEWPSDERLIRFDSPTDALLVAGARAIRTALSLGDTVGRSVDGAPPIDYFEPSDPDNEPADPQAILDDWVAARRARRTGYVPGGLKYNTAGWNPEQLQLAELRDDARLEIAITAGIDPEEVGVSTTSRTYNNQFDRRKNFTDFTLGLYRTAFEDRLKMGDIAPLGFVSRTNLSEFLRSDDKTRYETIRLGLDVGAIAPQEVRPMEGKPPLPQEDTVKASTATAQTFGTVAPALRLDAPGAQAFQVDVEKRTIRGMAVPWGEVATSGGRKFRFTRGSLRYTDVSRVKLWVHHDGERAVGVMFEADDRLDGMYGAWRIARGPAGDEALTMAADGVWDGLSVGLLEEPKGRMGRDGVFDITDVPWLETSLTPAPAFDNARVHSVAASAAHQEGTAVFTEEQLAALRAAGIDPSNVDVAKAYLRGLTAQEQDKADGKTDDKADDKAGDKAGADTAPIVEAIAAGFSKLQASLGGGNGGQGRVVIPAGGAAARFAVTEGPLYRFDGTKGQYDFSTDLFAGIGHGVNSTGPDSEAYGRVMQFMAEQFGPRFVTTTDTAAVNPTGYRADMYVDEQRFATPLRDAFYKGSLVDGTPFTFARFNTGTGLVGDHTQGTEPTAGSWSTANGATITPAPLSGKVHITREVADQGGNPQVSGLIWGKIVYEYLKSLETKVAAMLDASSPAELGAALAQGASTVAALAAPIEAAIAGLNFIAGGNRFNVTATHIDLYLALAALKDGQQRPYYPVINPSNANGQTVAGYKSLDVAGTRFDPVWSLGVTSAGAAPAEKSYTADTSAVHVWHSAPTKLDRLQEKVEGYDLGVWGWHAEAISDITGIRKITYDLA